MKPEILMLAGAGLLAYWFFSKPDAPPATTPGANTTGGGATAPGAGTGTAPTTGVQNPPATGTNPPVQTKAQKLAAAAGGNSQSFDVWNFYYKQLFDPNNAQPEPEAYMGTNARDAKVSAESYLQLRGLSGVGYIFRRRYIN